MRWLYTTSPLVDGYPTPPQDSVVVVRRGGKGYGDVGWVSGDSFCLGFRHQGGSEMTCGPYDKEAAGPSWPAVVDYTPARAVGRIEGFSDGPLGDDRPDRPYYTLYAVVDDAGPFRLTGKDPRGIVRQARAVLEPGRAVTFVEWGCPGDEMPSEARVCSASTHRCLPYYV